MSLLGVLLVGFPLAGQPGIMLSDRPQQPIEEPRGPDGQIVSPGYDGYTPRGKPSMECYQETHTCYGSDGSMVEMRPQAPKNNFHKNTDRSVVSPYKLHRGDNTI